MKVKDAIKKLQTMFPDAELVVQLDEFPNFYSPVVDFASGKAGSSENSTITFLSDNVLQRCKKRIDLPNVRSIVICETYEV
jgi:hypothetical protein